ncbi:hypothetical protein DXG01_012956 [Tephrocybe rancida]|nr:hypothetical protein DXG01_012956 [Tephrocybe rancida]
MTTPSRICYCSTLRFPQDKQEDYVSEQNLASHMTYFNLVVSQTPIEQRKVVWSYVIALIVLNLALNIYLPFKLAQAPVFRDILHPPFGWLVILDFAIASLIDLVLCLLLIYALAKVGKKLDWTDTNFMVIAAYVINTGAIAALFSLSTLLSYIFMPTNLIFLACKVVLTTLYVNCLFAMLNARFYFQRSEGLVSVALPHGSVFMYENGGPASRIQATTDVSNHVTINEAGLPLFKAKNEVNHTQDIQLLEVKVTKEQAEIQDDSD